MDHTRAPRNQAGRRDPGNPKVFLAFDPATERPRVQADPLPARALPAQTLSLDRRQAQSPQACQWPYCQYFASVLSASGNRFFFNAWTTIAERAVWARSPLGLLVRNCRSEPSALSELSARW